MSYVNSVQYKDHKLVAGLMDCFGLEDNFHKPILDKCWYDQMWLLRKMRNDMQAATIYIPVINEVNLCFQSASSVR